MWIKCITILEMPKNKKKMYVDKYFMENLNMFINYL